ncbi:MAG: hypothetical protein KJ717_04745, partial [Proteobacteria bacterium]|nr:hypothetical protein [Pseudomonadota bacterium]
MPESLPTKPPFNEIALEAIKKIQQPLLLYGIVVSILLIFLLVMGRDVPSGLRPIVFALPGIVCLIAISHFTLEYFKRRPAIDSHSDISGVSVKRVFARSDSAEFCSCIESLIRHSHRLVVLIGTGLNILQRDPFAEEVMKRATEGHCRLEIYLADPSSPDVEVRLIEEELGDTSPPVGQPGLSRRLNTLMRLWERSGYSEDISINLFTHYPTFALLIVDNEYFFYPYGYATLGNFSPVLQFSSNRQQDDGIIEFLEKQYKRIKASALDTRIVFSVRNKPKPVDAGVLHPLAVYFIPPEDSDLYKFGTEVLGYDIRRGRSVAS